MASKKGDKKGDKNADGPINEKLTEIETINPEINKLLTARQLLYSTEDLVVLNVVIAIDKFVSKAIPQQLQFIFENNFIPLLLSLLPRHKNISRLALKTLVALEPIPGVKESIKSDLNNIQILSEAFVLAQDDIIQEYLTLLMKKICINEECRKIISREDVILKLNSAILHPNNPDLQKNCLEVLQQILLCSIAPTLEALFLADVFVCLLKNPYNEIQDVALEILFTISRWTSELLHEKLRESKMIEKLFQKLQTNEWTNDLNKALDIIIHCLRHPTLGKKEVESLDLLKLLQFSSSDTAIDAVVLATLAIIIEYVQDEFARQVLFDFKIHDLLIKFFERDCDIIKVKICEAFSFLVLNNSLAEIVSTKKLIYPLTRFMGQELLPWNPYRQAPIKTLYVLMLCSTTMPILLYRCNTLKPLSQAINSREEINKADFLMIIEIYQYLFFNKSIRKYILTERVYPRLLQLLQDEEYKICKIAFRVIENSIQLVKCQEWFRDNDGLNVIMNILEAQPNELCEEVTTFLEECIKYKNISLDFLHAGVIKHLHKLPKYKIQPGMAVNLMDSFYSYDLAMKFFHLNHLSYADITQNGFYIFLEKLPSSPDLKSFPTILSPSSTAITVNFRTRPTINVPVVPTVEKNREPLSASQAQMGRPPTTTSKFSSTSKDSDVIKEILPPEPPACISYDYYLCRCLKKAKAFIEPEETIENKIKALAIFVARQLSGYGHLLQAQSTRTMDFKLHMAALKKRLHSNIIPLGLIRFGGYTERALLFKVLADRMNILCDLYRCQTIMWCELPLLSCPPGDKCHVEWYIIDLMLNVGQLMPKNRWDANVYIRGGPKVWVDANNIPYKRPNANLLQGSNFSDNISYTNNN